MVNNPPANAEDAVQSLSWEDTLEKEMATHFKYFAWEIPWTEEPRRLQFKGSQRVEHNLVNKQQQHMNIKGNWGRGIQEHCTAL